MTAILFSPAIGPVMIDCVISEKPTSTLEITEIPVESGARITDHAVIAPKKLTLDIANANAAMSYQALVAFQESRVPFTMVTGLSIFDNMLIKSIETERDFNFSTVLRATVELQEIIIVETAYDPNATQSGHGGKQVANKNLAKTPTSSKTSDPQTSDRAASTVNRGDTGGNTPTPKNQSILHDIKEKYGAGVPNN